jgi:hypothetical protein
MHLGAYFDPGMECRLPEDLESLTREQLEEIFNAPFTSGSSDATYRIIKSHMFSEHIPFLRKMFPDTPIVLVRRDDDACLGWWVKCGHFDITYPDYHEYFKDFKHMAKLIKQQNAAIQYAMERMKPHRVYSNIGLANILDLELPPAEYKQSYIEHDIEVRVLL